MTTETTTTLFTCSIDDGHPSDMRMADLLERHGMAATFYIPIHNREGFEVLPADRIRALGRRFEIGSHTLDHCFLKPMSVDDAHYQIIAGKKALEDILGRPVDGFCYPGGQYGQRDADMVQSAGFRYARTTMNLCLDGGGNPYEMPTTCQFYPHSRSVYLRNYLRAGNWNKRSELMRLALTHPDWLTRVNAMFDHACDSGGVFHLWGHSRDIDAFDGWSAFDTFLARVAERVPLQRRITNAQLAAMTY